MFSRKRVLIGVLFAAILVASFTVSVLIRTRRAVQEVSGVADIANIRLPDRMPYKVVKVAGQEIYHVEFDTMKRQDQTLNAVLLFSDDPVFHGKILSPEALEQNKKDHTLAIGHNFSYATLEAFFTQAKEDGVVLPGDTQALLEFFQQLRVFGREGGIISTAQDVQDRERVIKHEFSHGKYFSDPEYRKHVKRIWLGLPQNTQQAIRSIFSQYNYNLADNDLVLREFAAWFEDEQFVTSSSGKTRELFIKIREDLLSYP